MNKKIEYIEVDKLSYAPFNPPSRITPVALATLKATIEDADGILMPLLITPDFVVIDGNRRLACAHILDYSHVPCVKTDLESETAWSLTNAGNIPINGRAVLEAVASGFPPHKVPKKHRKDIADLIRIVGMDGIRSLAEHGRSTSILRSARAVGNYIEDKSDEMIANIINWFELCQQQFVVRRAIAEECEPIVIISAIAENRPIHRMWE